MKLLCIGPLWRGSNAGALFRAFSRKGCIIEVIDEYYHLSLTSENLGLKIISKLIRPLELIAFNDYIYNSIIIYKPDVVFIYKGAFIYPNLLDKIKSLNIKIVNFYPDVSMFSHGNYIPRNLPKYDLIFTTKTFGIDDLRERFGLINSIFIPHGFDPEIHRPFENSLTDNSDLSNDVSFIGTWSPKKEKTLSLLIKAIPNLKLNIWGNQWNKASSLNLKKAIKHNAITGDLYALAIISSKINLGLLSEIVNGASSGDLITSRTFHIPASGGFLMHESNVESLNYYQKDIEAAFFENIEDLIEKVQYYLINNNEREAIRIAGYKRAIKDHSLDNRADLILHHLNKILS
jgi:spore maturation protein CgeB